MAKKIETKKINDENEIFNFIKIILIVTIIFILFYILTVFINKKDENSDVSNNSTKTEIQYDEILIGNIFKQSASEYYVLIEESDDVQVQVYRAYLSNYRQNKESKRVYYASLNNMLNSKYMAEQSNITNNINDLKIANTTLLEIKDSKIINKYETNEDILKILNEISKNEN